MCEVEYKMYNKFFAHTSTTVTHNLCNFWCVGNHNAYLGTRGAHRIKLIKLKNYSQNDKLEPWKCPKYPESFHSKIAPTICLDLGDEQLKK
jgi:hypothetical protein